MPYPLLQQIWLTAAESRAWSWTAISRSSLHWTQKQNKRLAPKRGASAAGLVVLKLQVQSSTRNCGDKRKELFFSVGISLRRYLFGTDWSSPEPRPSYPNAPNAVAYPRSLHSRCLVGSVSQATLAIYPAEVMNHSIKTDLPWRMRVASWSTP